MYNYSKLKGKIIERCGSMHSFAINVLNITPNQFSRILNNQSSFRQEQIRKCIDFLKIQDEEIGSYFFTREVA